MSGWTDELALQRFLQSMTLDAPLGFALMLIVGALAGEVVVRWTHLPRVFGYTLAGACAALLGAGMPMPIDNWWRLVIEWALALLLFEIGARLRLRWLFNNRALLVSSSLESTLSGLAVGGVLLAMGLRWELALAAAVITLPSSVAVAGRVAHEMGAEGQVTQRMGYLTALSTLYAVSLMVVVMAALKAGHAPDVLQALTRLASSTLASLALAAVLALGVSAVVKRLDPRNEGSVLLVLGMVLAAVALTRLTQGSTLLVALLAGIVLRNVSDRAWSWPRHFGTAGSALILVMFVLSGSAWTLPLLLSGGAMAVALVLARAAAKTIAVAPLARWSGLSRRQGLGLAITLTPLSASSLLMLSDVMLALPELGRALAPVVLSAVAILELGGPAAVKWGLIHAGEVPDNAPPKEL